jgi:hypothetical protein
MPLPQQGLEAHGVRVLQRDNRLILEEQGVVLDGLLKRGTKLQPRYHGAAQPGLVVAPLPFAGSLGRVQGEIGAAQQFG